MDRSAMSMRLLAGMSIPKMRGMRLTLALLVTLVSANDTNDALPTDNPAVLAQPFH
jgi:hypothetical protein